MKQIVLASNNAGKIIEFREIFAKFNIEIIAQNELNVPEVDEPYFTFVENSLHKARHCSKHTGLPALADDSGLCVSALNGEPGVFSARYAGEPKSDQKNIDKLLDVLSNSDKRDAYFYCSLVFVRSQQDPQPIIADGVFTGEIAKAVKGSNGHGYDPIFWLPQYNKTVAELDSEVKNSISHRGLAIQELLKKFRTLNIINLKE